MTLTMEIISIWSLIIGNDVDNDDDDGDDDDDDNDDYGSVAPQWHLSA